MTMTPVTDKTDSVEEVSGPFEIQIGVTIDAASIEDAMFEAEHISAPGLTVMTVDHVSRRSIANTAGEPVELLERALTAERHLAEAREVLRGLLRGEYESAEPGLCDCVDNDGKPYQSQFLADRIAAAEAALTTGAPDGK